MARDIVCGMMVDEKFPAAKTVYKEKEYFFCSMSCKIKFKKNPELYIQKDESREEEDQS